MATLDDFMRLLVDSLPRDEQDRPAFAWYQQADNPIGALGNVLGIAGTVAKNPIQAGVIEPALGAALLALRESGLQPRQSALAPVDPGRPAQLGQDELRRYLLASTPEGIPAFARGMVTDPLSYVGTGLFRAAGQGVTKAGAGIRPLEATGRAISAVDDKYLEAVNAGMRATGKIVKAGASRTPVIKAFTEDAPTKELARFTGDIGRAIQTLPAKLGGVERLFGGLEGLGLRAGSRVWADLAEGWVEVDAAISQLEHPLQQVAVLQQRKTAVELKNMIEARAAQAREGVEDSFRDGIINARERSSDMDHIWTLQARGVHGVQEGLLDAIKEAKNVPITGRLDEATEAAIGQEMGSVLKEISDWQLQARDLARGLGEVGEGLPGEVLRAGDDTFYRQARNQLTTRLAEFVPDIQARYADVVAPDDINSVMTAAQGAFDARFGHLQQFSQELPDQLAGMATAKRTILVDNADEIGRSLRRVLAARRRITNEVEPLLDGYYRELGETVQTRAAKVARALSDSKTLLAEPALADPSAWGVRKRVEDIIKRFQDHGDILNPRDSGALTVNMLAGQKAAALGIEKLPPWFGFAATALSQWRELALLSPRYHISNLMSILTLSQNAGVSPARIMRNLGDYLVDASQHGWLSNDRWHPAVTVGGKYASTRGGELPSALLGYQGINQGEAFVNAGRGSTALGRMPLALRVGLPAAATGASYWQANEQDPNRLAGTVGAAALGGAFGAAAPRFVTANKMLAQATEHAARGTAFTHRFDEVMTKAGEQFAPQIKAILGKPITFQSMGKPAYRGERRVRNLADLMGGADDPFPLGGTPSPVPELPPPGEPPIAPLTPASAPTTPAPAAPSPLSMEQAELALEAKKLASGKAMADFLSDPARRAIRDRYDDVVARIADAKFFPGKGGRYNPTPEEIAALPTRGKRRRNLWNQLSKERDEASAAHDAAWQEFNAATSTTTPEIAPSSPTPEAAPAALPEGTMSFEDFQRWAVNSKGAFSDDFNRRLNDAGIAASRNRGRTPPTPAGTLREALSPEFASLFPDEVLDTPIIFGSRLGNEAFTGFAAGRDPDTGKYIIAMNPDQAVADYVPGVLHEAHHLVDRLKGKPTAITGVSPANYSAYRKLPSERRAQAAEKRYMQKVYKLRQGQANPVVPPNELPNNILSVRMSEASPTVRTGEDVDWQAVEATFKHLDGNLTPDQMYDLAIRHRATPEQADALRAAWDETTTMAEREAISFSNKINFDYSDVSKGIAFLRNSGIAPFVTWTSKALPLYASILAQNPRYIVAIDALNNLGEEDIEEAGLSQKFARMARMGVLGDFLANIVLGRPDATVMGSPLQALFPFADVGRPSKVGEGANLLERGLDAAQTVGFGPSPLLTLPLQAIGALSNQPMNVLRTSSYLEGATSPLGNAADPEAMVKQGIRGVRELFGNEQPDTITGSEIKDYYIRQRIAEMAMEATGKPPAGDYRRAMDDPNSPIWQLARRQVERQQAGQTALSAVLSFRTKALTKGEETVAAARSEQGVAPADFEGTTKEMRSEMWKQATGANPLAGAFSALGNDEAQVLARQFPEMQAVWKRTSRMRPAQRAKMRNAWLADKPVMRRWLAEHNVL